MAVIAVLVCTRFVAFVKTVLASAFGQLDQSDEWRSLSILSDTPVVALGVRNDVDVGVEQPQRLNCIVGHQLWKRIQVNDSLRDLAVAAARRECGPCWPLRESDAVRMLVKGVRRTSYSFVAVRVGADTDAQRPCHPMPSVRWWVGHVTVRRAAICLAAIIIRLSVVLRASELRAGIARYPLHGQTSLLVRIDGYRRRACSTRVKT